MTSTFDNCCQRAKVHRLVTLPVQSCKVSWSCCVYFSQVFVLILSTWKFGFIIFLSVIQRIIIFLSPIQLLIIFLSPIQRIIIFLSPIQLIIIWVFLSASKLLFLFLNVSQRLSFVLLGTKQCPIVVLKQFHIYLLFLDYLIMFQMLFLIMYKTSRFWPLV